MDTIVDKREELIKNLMNIGELIVVPNIFLFVLLFSVTIFTNFNNPDGMVATLVSISFPFCIGYILYPWVRFIKNREDLNKYGLVYRKNWIEGGIIFVSLAILVYCLIILYNRGEVLEYLPLGVNFIFIAIGEEILTRGILIDKLKKIMKLDYAIWVGALIFSFIFHNNGGFMINLLIRFPLGLVLGYMYKYSKSLYGSIFFHLAYNVMVSSI